MYAWEKATLLLGSVLLLVSCSWSTQAWGERLHPTDGLTGRVCKHGVCVCAQGGILGDIS